MRQLGWRGLVWRAQPIAVNPILSRTVQPSRALAIFRDLIVRSRASMTYSIRPVNHSYCDPLDLIWQACATQIGFKVERTSTVYASFDGRGTILIGTDDVLDADDSLAQMVFHELCHALVEGEKGEGFPDWGLDNTSGRDRWREHACLRVQAYLAEAYGLRAFFAPTTSFRVGFWECLTADPFASAHLQGGRRERSCVAARQGVWRSYQRRWHAPLHRALAATATIASLIPNAAVFGRGATQPHKAAHLDPSTASPMDHTPLWFSAEPVPHRHPSGHAVITGYSAEHHCSDCAWWYSSGRRQGCRHAPHRRLDADTPACVRWESASELECGSCGACCREAYDSVEVDARDSISRKHPDLVVVVNHHLKLRRTAGRCQALEGGDTPIGEYRCRIYPDRPRNCREFERGGPHCLEARRRVGLSL